ncbi:MAG: helix-turn-helix domain-containing protein, partial [Desulfobacteraceae bacterium]
PSRIKDYRPDSQQPPAPVWGIPGRDDDLPVLAEVERRYIRHVLEKVGGNKRRAASILGIGRRTLYRRLGEEAQSE